MMAVQRDSVQNQMQETPLAVQGHQEVRPATKSDNSQNGSGCISKLSHVTVHGAVVQFEAADGQKKVNSLSSHLCTQAGTQTSMFNFGINSFEEV